MKILVTIKDSVGPDLDRLRALVGDPNTNMTMEILKENHFENKGGYVGPGEYEDYKGNRHSIHGLAEIAGVEVVLMGNPEGVPEVMELAKFNSEKENSPFPRYLYMRPLQRDDS